jgi:hypothetical protein
MRVGRQMNYLDTGDGAADKDWSQPQPTGGTPFPIEEILESLGKDGGESFGKDLVHMYTPG